MGVMSAIQKAKTKEPPNSASLRVWRGLGDEERTEIIGAMESDLVGPGKLSQLLTDEGVVLSKHFLQKVKRGEI